MLVTVARMRRRTSPLPRPRRAALALALAALAAAFMLAGCAPRAHAPSPKPPAPPASPRTAAAPAPLPRPAAGYVARRDSLPPADSTLLAGRRIAIDPGHGGFFRGCLGVNGLTEAEVNLAVALDLRALLVARGATVFLTRSTDRDFLTRSDSTLKSDLAERSRLANAFRPDLFVSIHHNADPGGAHSVNETQTYYQLGDEGPSYDAGADVHRALVRNLGIETQKLLPGNFSVVRHSEAPALLTESSYLTNPDVEAKLATPEARELEAEALLVGIARFFARKAPVVESVWVEPRADQPAAASNERAPGRHAIHARVHGRFDDVRVRVDGADVPADVAGDAVTALLESPLAIGTHEAAVTARLAGEGTSRTRTLDFDVRKSASVVLRADVPSADATPSRGAIPLRVRVLDIDGVPRPDSARVHVRVVWPATLVPRETTIVAHDGIAWAYYRLPGAVPLRQPLRWSLTGGEHADESADPVVTTANPLELDRPGERTGFALAMPSGARLRGAPGTSGFAPAVTWINRDGFVAVRAESSGAARVPRLAGYRTWGEDGAWPPRLVAIASGALFGRRVVLDPEGGGDDAGGTGPSGTRAATVNLDVARALASMLRAAGAEVLLTREGDAAVSDVERVQRAEAFRADRYLRIGHAATAPMAGHYFASVGGGRWAARVAEACRELGLADSLAVREAAKYALTQASATALYVTLARVDSTASEAALLQPGTVRREAYALWLSLAREFAPESHWNVERLVVRDAGGAPLPHALVTLGGALVLAADADGTVRFARTEPGPLEVVTDDSRTAARTLLLDSAPRPSSDAR